MKFVVFLSFETKNRAIEESIAQLETSSLILWDGRCIGGPSIHLRRPFYNSLIFGRMVRGENKLKRKSCHVD